LYLESDSNRGEVYVIQNWMYGLRIGRKYQTRNTVRIPMSNRL